ncbi:hypothetical protein HJC23_003987 [Cyclotella cryptica]|uniref:Uncharacterized protein n=1 Tax=Cyclotella cryptica TaxID=29204 RepID=A0ABD3QUA2_9STRA
MFTSLLKIKLTHNPHNPPPLRRPWQHSFDDGSGGDVGLDRTPKGVRSPLARPTIKPLLQLPSRELPSLSLLPPSIVAIHCCHPSLSLLPLPIPVAAIAVATGDTAAIVKASAVTAVAATTRCCHCLFRHLCRRCCSCHQGSWRRCRCCHHPLLPPVTVAISTAHRCRLSLPLLLSALATGDAAAIVKASAVTAVVAFSHRYPFVGSVFAGSGFLLIHRELSHRRRLTTKWEIQEYVEAQWKGIKNSSGESVANSSKKIMNSNGHLMQTDWLTSSWNKAIATVREFASQKK